jgi:hypothetical protein
MTLQSASLAWLRIALANPTVNFRDGQWEAIDQLVSQRGRVLCVQRTGWGKSMVYFVSAKLMREQGAGPTLIISPLLALMRNQIEAANRLKLRAETINSTNSDDWQAVRQRLLNDEIDLLLISPERLANDEFVTHTLLPIAARIVGYIRQAAIGDALVPYDERVDHALQKLLASRTWTAPQRDWLKKIAAQTKANLLVDREALDEPDLVFKREGGGFNRLDKIFEGRLPQVLEAFNEAIWSVA